ncbi:hypothetical protein HF521_017974 [Silurus meridionalis]|uniref:F-box domain-containing protein n=1 Tax=Silurus meridionalis TaxID=175797 RepID=A0A8T0BTS2_SILME|nr:hypothetical protein HF521_017974 [Silurus meridionalis]
MGANNGKQCGSEGKGSSSISSDVSSGTDHTPTKAPRNVTASEDSDLSMRTHSTPSPALILNLIPSHISPQSHPNGHESQSSSPSPSPTIPRETVAIIHAPPGSCKKASKSHSTTLAEFLPDPVMLQIFSHLSTPQLCRCSRVCRRWYSLAWDPRLWRTILLSGELLHADRALRSSLSACARTPLMSVSPWRQWWQADAQGCLIVASVCWLSAALSYDNLRLQVVITFLMRRYLTSCPAVQTLSTWMSQAALK